MDTIHITKEGSVYTVPNIRCQVILHCGEEDWGDIRCQKYATIMIKPDWAPALYVCSEHQVEMVKNYLTQLPRKL